MCTHRAHLRLQLLPLRHRLPGCGLMMLHYSSLVLGSVNGRAHRPRDTGPHLAAQGGHVKCALHVYKAPKTERIQCTSQRGQRNIQYSNTFKVIA